MSVKIWEFLTTTEILASVNAPQNPTVLTHSDPGLITPPVAANAQLKRLAQKPNISAGELVTVSARENAAERDSKLTLRIVNVNQFVQGSFVNTATNGMIQSATVCQFVEMSTQTAPQINNGTQSTASVFADLRNAHGRKDGMSLAAHASAPIDLLPALKERFGMKTNASVSVQELISATILRFGTIPPVVAHALLVQDSSVPVACLAPQVKSGRAQPAANASCLPLVAHLSHVSLAMSGTTRHVDAPGLVQVLEAQLVEARRTSNPWFPKLLTETEMIVNSFCLIINP